MLRATFDVQPAGPGGGFGVLPGGIVEDRGSVAGEVLEAAVARAGERVRR